MAKELARIVGELDSWKVLPKAKREAFRRGISGLPDLAMRFYYAQYLDLMLESREFFAWAAVYEHAKTQSLVIENSINLNAQLNAVLSSNEGIDIGLRRLEAGLEAVRASSTVDNLANIANRVAEALARTYSARINELVIKDDYAEEVGKTTLRYPSKVEAFIPQSYRRLRYESRSVNLEDERLWEAIRQRNDLAAFMVSYLSSPYSTEAPLLVLGHPGSGKSLLTEVVAARLAPPNFNVVRIELRDINPETSFQSQIEDQILQDSGFEINWATYAESLTDNPLVIILDGYDELLQANGRIFSNYLEQVHKFQRRESAVGRPVRVLVTSRITLIDKAVIPIGSSIMRLDEFDSSRQQRWIARWNDLNHSYYAASEIQPFSLPKNSRLLALAQQPLLLLMLALYDSQSNQLRDAKLDQTLLYHSLLQRFIERERAKGDNGSNFNALSPAERRAQVDVDLQRLGVAAIGMFNRKSLHISRKDLDSDIAFFETGQAFPVKAGAVALTQADLLLGSFFFIHESRSKSGDPDDFSRGEAAAFEFLHNTFGEFLAADFILRRILVLTDLIAGLRANPRLAAALHEQLTLLDKHWFACLSYSVLHSRPVVLNMIREWLPHRLAELRQDASDFYVSLGLIINRQLDEILNTTPPAWFLQGKDKTPFERLPLLGHLSTYTVNLVLLAAVLNEPGYDFLDASGVDDGGPCKSWDRLVNLWRSWFDLNDMAGIAAIVYAERKVGLVRVLARPEFSLQASRSSAETLFNVNTALAEDLAGGLSGLGLARLQGLPRRQAERALADLGKSDVNVDLESLAQIARYDEKKLAVWEDRLRDVVGFLARSPEGLMPGAALEVLAALRLSGLPESLERLRPVKSKDAPRRLRTLSRYEATLVIEVKSQLEPLWLRDLLRDLSRSTPDFLALPLGAPLLRVARTNHHACGSWLTDALEKAEFESVRDVETAVELVLACVEGNDKMTGLADIVLSSRLSSWDDMADVPALSWVSLLWAAGASRTRLPRTAAGLVRASGQELGFRGLSSRASVTALALDASAWHRSGVIRENRVLFVRENRVLFGGGNDLLGGIVSVLLRAARRWREPRGMMLILGSILMLDDERRWAVGRDRDFSHSLMLESIKDLLARAGGVDHAKALSDLAWLRAHVQEAAIED
ncbi:ATP-binding protein [Micromonospora sp. DSM 115977]|uniref:ATP-binding protein n=2 Tax=Micromonospora reichwaldensis TaxID=3075516 RepID=A0ABU2WZB0_9ACTN|nr:ATP-binding protein [Micromonospora sp. DSM 115977]MDT0530377.1 ATP-binding protein [Micromonospora sp. DSM 115977]